MSEAYAETHGISGTLTEVCEDEIVHKSIEELELEWYLAWEAAENARKQHELEEHRKFLDRCRQAEQAVRIKYEQNPGHSQNEVPIWEREGLKEISRHRAKVDHDYLKFKQEGKEFSPAAWAAVHNLNSAEFLDNAKCDYLGDSDHDGWFREISPTHNLSPFDVQFDYNIGVMNAYTPSGNIIHIRETDDPAAKVRSQRQLILAMNVLTREVTRYYPEDETIITPTQGIANHYDEMITLQPRILSPVNREPLIGPEHKFATIYEQAINEASRQSLAKILYSGKGTIHFKREGFVETFESLHPIKELDRERSLLIDLAHAAGKAIGERGVIQDPRSRPQIAIAA